MPNSLPPLPSQPQPTPPARQTPSETWVHYGLWMRVIEALENLPREFNSTITVSGIAATQVYTFGAVLGATIEEEVVRTLNNLKPLWDPDNAYDSYRFVRQSQTFPDVVLQAPEGATPLLGIELKSWYLLAKEGEPSLRFHVTPRACSPQDLFVVVPWALSNVLSGSPLVYEPFIESARYVAEYRNYWWQSIRVTEADAAITSPTNVMPYPGPKTQINDMAVSDSGNNFGRVARIKLQEFDDWVARFADLSLLGILVGQWRKFFRDQIG